MKRNEGLGNDGLQEYLNRYEEKEMTLTMGSGNTKDIFIYCFLQQIEPIINKLN